jgi:hypothetical protein
MLASWRFGGAVRAKSNMVLTYASAMPVGGGGKSAENQRFTNLGARNLLPRRENLARRQREILPSEAAKKILHRSDGNYAAARLGGEDAAFHGCLCLTALAGTRPIARRRCVQDGCSGRRWIPMFYNSKYCCAAAIF